MQSVSILLGQWHTVLSIVLALHSGLVDLKLNNDCQVEMRSFSLNLRHFGNSVGIIACVIYYYILLIIYYPPIFEQCQGYSFCTVCKHLQMKAESSHLNLMVIVSLQIQHVWAKSQNKTKKKCCLNGQKCFGLCKLTRDIESTLPKPPSKVLQDLVAGLPHIQPSLSQRSRFRFVSTSTFSSGYPPLSS